MSRSAVVVLLFLAFASGMGSGFVLGRSRAVHGIDIATPQEILDAMADEIGLSADQKAECGKIQAKYHPEAVRLKGLIKNDLSAIRTKMRAEMSAVMSEEQRVGFNAFSKRRDDQRDAQETLTPPPSK